MKNLLLTVVCVFFTHTMLAQSISVNDWDNNGILEYVKYSDKGVKLEEGFILDGKYHGRWTSYEESGKIRVVAQFKYGKKDGVWEFYNDNGEITHQVVYADNKRVSASLIRYFE